MNKKIYPDSGVEIQGFIARHYDRVMNLGTLGFYSGFIKKAVRYMDIRPGDHILDMGCGTGRNAELMRHYLNQDGRITGMDISHQMQQQFNRRFQNDERAEYITRRIDVPFQPDKMYDKILIAFVIHGFPHHIRHTVIQNAANHLKAGGHFYILDFAEFDMAAMPPHHRFVFQKVECKYAFDYIKRDWKEILARFDFEDFEEKFFLKKYLRLLRAQLKKT